MGVDAETLARTGLQRTLQDVFSRGGDESADGEEGEGEEQDPARSIIEGIIGGQKKPKEQSDDQQQGDSETSARSTEETLINEGLNAIFGKKKAPPAEETKEEEPQQ